MKAVNVTTQAQAECVIDTIFLKTQTKFKLVRNEDK